MTTRSMFRRVLLSGCSQACRRLGVEWLEDRITPSFLGLPGYADEVVPFPFPVDITGIAVLDGGGVALVDSFAESITTPTGASSLQVFRNQTGNSLGPTSGGPDGFTSIYSHDGFLYVVAVSPFSTDAIFKVTPDLTSVSLFATPEIFDRGDRWNYSDVAIHDATGHLFLARESSLAEFDAGGTFLSDLSPGDFNGVTLDGDTLYALAADGEVMARDLAVPGAVLTTLIDLPGNALYTDLKFGTFGGAVGLFVESIENGVGHLSFFPTTDLLAPPPLLKPIRLFDVPGATGKFDLSASGELYVAQDASYLHVRETLRLEVVESTVLVPEGAGAVPVIRVSADAPPIYPMTVFVERVTGDTDLDATSLRFTMDPRSWRADHYVSLSAADDTDVLAGEATFRISQQNGTPVFVTAREKDNDNPFGLELRQQTVSVPEGQTNIVQFRLRAMPPAAVTIHTARTGGDTDLGVAFHADLTIPPEQWAEWHYATIAAAPDADGQNGTATFTVTAPNSAPVTFTATETDSASGLSEYTITVDSFEALPLQGETQLDAYYNNLNGDRGKVENNGVTTFRRGYVESTVTAATGYAGVFESVNRTLADGRSLNFAALLNANIKPGFQYHATALEFEILDGTGSFKVELIDPNNTSLASFSSPLPGGPMTITIPLTNPPANVQSINWLVEGPVGSFVRVGRVGIAAEGPNLGDRAPLLWSLNSLLQNLDPVSFLVADQGRFPTPDFASTNSMGALAALMPAAVELEMIEPADAQTIVAGIRDALLDLQADASHLGVLPHFVRQRFIVDNSSSDFAISAGNWTPATTPTGFYGGNYLTAEPGAHAEVSWSFDLSRQGNYQVYARWPTGQAAANAPYTIHFANGQSTTVLVDQRVNGDEWVLLGEFPFLAGGYSVTLSNNGVSSPVAADAIRLSGPPHIIPGTEYSVIDGGIGFVGTIIGLQGLNMPTAPMEQALGAMDWAAITVNNLVSHG
ncbi:MAG TPA: hypothetical protein VD866_01815, partial [Urbifossiella sp.]|nr:hypothetical protein [Urbifossiella sp.]